MKISLLLAGAGLVATSCFADPLLLTVKTTPYDRQMTPVYNVVTMASPSGDQPSIALVNTWMTDLRSIPYGYQATWRTPSEVESRRPADCKGKAVALYHRMRAYGATNLRLVIGKRAPTSRQSHAWLEWQTENRTYLLDPTFNYTVTQFQKIRRNYYVPMYEYAGSQKFRAAAALVALN